MKKPHHNEVMGLNLVSFCNSLLPGQAIENSVGNFQTQREKQNDKSFKAVMIAKIK